MKIETLPVREIGLCFLILLHFAVRAIDSAERVVEFGAHEEQAGWPDEFGIAVAQSEFLNDLAPWIEHPNLERGTYCPRE
jgi:hypothetical protein